MANKIFGYARVSTKSQKLERQLDMLKEYEVPVENTYVDKITGGQLNRESLDSLRSQLRSGDTLVVESITRLSRSTKDLINLIDELNKLGVTLICLKEQFDFSTPSGKMVLTMLIAISQLEKDLIGQRVAEGIESARARGRVGGRPKASKHLIEKALRMYDTNSFGVTEICKDCKISKSTLYRYINARDNKSES